MKTLYSGVDTTQWDVSDSMNNLQEEEIKGGAILLIEALIRLSYLVGSSRLGAKRWRGGCLKRKASRKLRRE